MVKKSIGLKRAKTLSLSIVIGTGVALITSFLLSAVLTSLILKGVINESAVAVCMFFVRMITVLIGGLFAATLSQKKILPAIGIMTAAYLLVLLCAGIIIFDQSLDGFGLGILSALVGGTFACVIKLMAQRKQKKMSYSAR